MCACVHSRTRNAFTGQNVPPLIPNPLSEQHKLIVKHECKSGVQRSHNYFLLPICLNMDHLLPFPSSSTISSTKFLTKSRSCDLPHAQQFFRWLTYRLAGLPLLYLNGKTKVTGYPKAMLRKSEFPPPQLSCSIISRKPASGFTICYQP